MRHFLTIAGLSVARVRRDKALVLAMTGCALVFTAIFGSLFGRASKGPKSFPVMVSDEDTSPASADVLAVLFADPAFSLRTSSTDELLDAVRLGKVGAASIVLAGFLLAVTGLGTMLATLVTTQGQLQAITPIVVVATSMLGGCYWPLEVVPKPSLAKFTPQGWRWPH